MNEVVTGETYSLTVVVRDSANVELAKTAPVIDAVNDFLISINGGDWDTLDNAPIVSPVGSEFIDITLSAAETTAAGDGGYIKLRVSDAAGGEWIGSAYRFDVHGLSLPTLISGAEAAITGAIAATETALDAAITSTEEAIIADTGATETAILTAIDDVPTAAEIDTELSGTHGATSWLTADTSALLAALLAALDDLDVIPIGAGVQPEISGALAIVRATTFDATVSFQSIPSDWTEAIMTVKSFDDLAMDDSQAILQITESGGLMVLNGDIWTTSDASLTVDQPNSTVTIHIEDDATAELTVDNNYVYDVKFLYGASKSVAYSGRLRVTATPTQTV